MKTSYAIPVFSGTSAMHRVFGDHQESTDIRRDRSEVATLKVSGKIEIKVRRFHRKPTQYGKRCEPSQIVRRYECYYNGIIIDYSTEAKLILKTFKWMKKHGQIHGEA